MPAERLVWCKYGTFPWLPAELTKVHQSSDLVPVSLEIDFGDSIGTVAPDQVVDFGAGAS